MLASLIKQLAVLIGLYKKQVVVENAIFSANEQIYQAALSCLGKDASPNDLAPDELGCAESVSDVLILAGIPFKVYLSTTLMDKYLSEAPEWAVVAVPRPGDILMSATGKGGLNGLLNGHVGVYMGNNQIASNSSATGTFVYNYTLDTWKKRYTDRGGYPMAFYRKVL